MITWISQEIAHKLGVQSDRHNNIDHEMRFCKYCCKFGEEVVED